jgi:DUF1365 family protein
MHLRSTPVRHRFHYNIYWFGLDLDELPELHRRVRGFSYNRRNLLSIMDADYGGPGGGDLRNRIDALLQQSGVTPAPARIVLMTIPRVAGYVFNPVNFYLCYGAENELTALVCEVRNTFGEMHHYVAAPEASSGRGRSMFRFSKQFYVSPFFETDGYYQVVVRHTDDIFDVTINLHRGTSIVFHATMNGQAKPLTTSSMLKTLIRMPLAATLIMLRIHWQAVQLRIRRGIPTHLKPEPIHPSTTSPGQASRWYRIRKRLLLAASASTPESGERRQAR